MSGIEAREPGMHTRLCLPSCRNASSAGLQPAPNRLGPCSQAPTRLPSKLGLSQVHEDGGQPVAAVLHAEVVLQRRGAARGLVSRWRHAR